MTSVTSTPRQAAKAWVRRQGWLAGSIIGTDGPGVVVTLDDGPDAVVTPAMLSVLRRHQASATFFVLLSRVRRHPEVLQEVLAEGHEIALHGVDHQPLTRFSFGAAVARTREAKEELACAVGAPVRWFRPPYGAQTPSTWAATRVAGLTPVLWSGTTWDWKDVPAQVRIDQAAEATRPGAILLAHDGIAGISDGVEDGPPPPVDRAALLDRVLEVAASRGLSCRSLSGELQRGGPVRAVSFTGLRRSAEVGARP